MRSSNGHNVSRSNGLNAALLDERADSSSQLDGVDGEEKRHHHSVAFHKLQENAEENLEKQSALVIDADTLKAAKEEHLKMKETLANIKKIAGNARIQIQECELLIELQREKLEAFDRNSISEEKQHVVNALERAQNNLRNAQNRLKNINIIIPTAEQKVADAKTAEYEAAQKFILHYPGLYKTYTGLYASYLFVDILFSVYTIKMAGDSFNSFADAWGMNKLPDLAALMIALTPAMMDLFFNMLMYNPKEMAIERIHELYTLYGYGFKPNSAIAMDFMRETLRTATVFGTLGGALNIAAILTHNLLGGAADLVGVQDFGFIKDTPAPVLWLLGLGIVTAANGYYSLSQDAKYYRGIKDGKAYRQLLKTFVKLFSKDFPRAFDVLYRGLFSSALMRALSFYYLADQVRQMDPALNWVNPALSLIIVTHHTICVRYGVTFDAAFGAKENDLPKIFQQIKIQVQRDQIIDERVKAGDVYQRLIQTNRNLLENVRTKNQALSPTQLLANARELYLKTLSEKDNEELDTEALMKVADMLPVPPDAELPDDLRIAHAKERILASARLESDLYLQRKTKSLHRISKWQDMRRDIYHSSIIAVLRGLVGGILMAEYGMKLVDAIADNDALSTDARKIVQVATSLTASILIGTAYYKSVQQSALDEKAKACFIKDDYSTEVVIAQAEVAEEKSSQILVVQPPVEHLHIPPPAPTNLAGATRFSEIAAQAISIGSCTIRLFSGVAPTIYPLRDAVPPKVLVSVVTLTLAEQQANGYSVFYDNIFSTIYSYVSTASCFKRPDDRAMFQRGNGINPSEQLVGPTPQRTFFGPLLRRFGLLPQSDHLNKPVMTDIPLEERVSEEAVSNDSSRWRQKMRDLNFR